MFVAGDFVLGFFDGGDSGEGGGVAGHWMMGDGVICAVFGGLGTVIVVVCRSVVSVMLAVLSPSPACRLSAC